MRLIQRELPRLQRATPAGVTLHVVHDRTHTIRASVQKTGRLVIADEAGPTAGFSAEVAAVVSEDSASFSALKAPVKRVCALQVPIPYAPILENTVFPDRNRIIAGIREVLA